MKNNKRISPAVHSRKLIWLILFLIFEGCASNQKASNNVFLLPGSKIYDITQPASWGGDPSLAATPDDPTDDDALAINAALQAAADFLDSSDVMVRPVLWENRELVTYQQLIYFPEGTYHLATPLVVRESYAGPDQFGRKGRYTWLYGSGEDKTVFKLKPASEIGLFGSEETPKTLLQIVKYDPAAYQGNDNFQLFVTDVSVIIPEDQPHAIGISYGMANLGTVRNVTIKAEGEGGNTGFALIQKNTGPGTVENLTVEGFDKGIEILDPWGEAFTFLNITLRNQNAGGTGISIADKQIGIENLKIEQDEPDVIPILLHDDRYANVSHGGIPHLTLLNASISSSAKSDISPIVIERGHTYLRNISTSGYSDKIILDHKTPREFKNGSIPEYVSVHGKTGQEKENVIVTVGGAPAKSLMLPVKPTPKIDCQVFSKMYSGDYTIVSQNELKKAPLQVNTSWAIVVPAKGGDDSELLQAALNSGAKYIGILNTEPLILSKKIHINETGEHGVELIFGYMSEIRVSSKISKGDPENLAGNNILFAIGTGSADKLFIKGLRVTAEERWVTDYTLFQNNFAGTLTFEDFICWDCTRGYSNGKESEGQDVFFNDVFFNSRSVYNDIIMKFKNQNVWGRQFDVEELISPDSEYYEKYSAKDFIKRNSKARIANQGGKVWIFSSKLGEHNGVFISTSEGGKTELLSGYFNSDRNTVEGFHAPNFLVEGTGSEFSMTGQERIRTSFNDQGIAVGSLPHNNQFGMIINSSNDTTIVKATELPAYLNYKGFDPFNNSDFEIMNQKNHYRVAGLIRISNNFKK